MDGPSLSSPLGVCCKDTSALSTHCMSARKVVIGAALDLHSSADLQTHRFDWKFGVVSTPHTGSR